MTNQIMFLNSRGELRNSKDGGVIATGHDGVKSYHNALGGEQQTTTQTSILADVIQTKFYTLDLTEFVPMVTGEGNPFTYNLMQWKTSITGDGFSAGYQNLGSNNTLKQSGDIEIEPINRKTQNWAKSANWNIMQEGTFSQATQNMDYVQQLVSARKEEYDLGIQQVVFLGDSRLTGLLNMVGVNINTTTITKPLSTMTATEFNTVVARLVEDYRTNCNRTAYPNTFVMPESDYNGLVNQMSEAYPLRTKLDVLSTALKEVTRNPNFKVIPCAYSDKAYNSLGKSRYALYNNDKKTLRMDIPLPFTVTLPNSRDNFNFESAAYSRFTGVDILRDKEVLYYDLTA